jgi:hypothetical protein
MLTTVVLRQVFWLFRPLPAFPFDKEQWHISGKGAYPGVPGSELQRRDRSRFTRDSLLGFAAPKNVCVNFIAFKKISVNL